MEGGKESYVIREEERGERQEEEGEGRMDLNWFQGSF